MLRADVVVETKTNVSTGASVRCVKPKTAGVTAVADGTVYVVDGSGVAHAIDAATLKVKWTFASRGGAGNCNNVSSPAVLGDYLHFGTTAGYYYVLNRKDGSVVHEIDCREPIFSAPAVTDKRAYFATLGAQVYAVEADGQVAWTWDFVKEVIKFDGN